MAARRTAMSLSAGLVCVCGLFLAARLRHRPPARLIAGRDNVVVINNKKPVQLPMRVLDAAGDSLVTAGVRYRRLSGAAIPITAHGAVTCTARSDATVLASLGALNASFALRCRPLRDLRTDMFVEFVAGDSARQLRFVGIDLDGRPEQELTGELHVKDSTVATLHGTRLRPVSVGRTFLDMYSGDAWAHGEVLVYEPVGTLERLRPEQRFVAAAVTLAAGDSIHWRLPIGLFSMHWLAARGGGAIPTMRVDGAVMCMPALGPGVDRTFCLVRAPGAELTLANRAATGEALVGRIALER